MARITRSSLARGVQATATSKIEIAAQQLSTPPLTPSPVKNGRKWMRNRSLDAAGGLPALGDLNGKPGKAKARGKRKREAAAKAEDDINELPHNLGSIVHLEEPDPADADPSPRRSSRSLAKKTAEEQLRSPDTIKAAAKLVASVESDTASPSKKARTKANPYGLTPGQTPYPDWPHPTPEQCQEVTDLLSAVHGQVQVPAKIPPPSTTVSGCGEVPSILDALIRTLLSAATTGTNSSRAFKGLVDAFGLLKEGVGKGSVDWNRVRLADRAEVFAAIKSGGLADVKSRRIKEILDMVYDENRARRLALIKAEAGESDAAPRGAENETADEKASEIARADQHVLSLDHLHALSSDEALNALIKYPGIGPKTASCVLLFCMQRPSFAVDTHVFRLCKWLNWVPANKATRNSTYSHCEVRIPDRLKYPLHQLMIRHGKTCPRCRASTGPGSESWSKGCPIEHLVNRSGKRKGEGGSTAKKSKKGRKNVDEEEEEDDDDEVEDADDDDEEDAGEEKDEDEDEDGSEGS